MVRKYLRKILVGALNGRMYLFFDLAFLSGLPVAHGVVWYIFLLQLTCNFTRPASVFFLNKRNWFQFRRFEQIEKTPSDGPTFLAGLLGRVKLWAIQTNKNGGRVADGERFLIQPKSKWMWNPYKFMPHGFFSDVFGCISSKELATWYLIIIRRCYLYLYLYIIYIYIYLFKSLHQYRIPLKIRTPFIPQNRYPICLRRSGIGSRWYFCLLGQYDRDQFQGRKSSIAIRLCLQEREGMEGSISWTFQFWVPKWLLKGVWNEAREGLNPKKWMVGRRSRFLFGFSYELPSGKLA